MKRSISASALQRVRKLSDAVRDVFVHTTTNEPRHTRDDSTFDYRGRGRRPRKSGESGLYRTQSHRNISKDDIRPYSRINPSNSTLDLWVGGGKVKDDGERARPGADTPLRSRFSADTDVIIMQTRRGRKAEMKALGEKSPKKEKGKRPEVPVRPIGEDLLSDVFGERNAEGLAPPPACAVREQLKEEMRRQKMSAARTARTGEDWRPRGTNTQGGQGLSRHGGSLRDKVEVSDEVGPPVPPKDYVPAKMSSPFATIPRSSAPPTSQPAYQRQPRHGVGADLTRGLSTKSAPEGTVGVSKMVPTAPRRPVTLDERRHDLDMVYATTGHVQGPRTTEAPRRMPSSDDMNIKTPTRLLQPPHSRPLYGRPAHSDKNEPRRGRTPFQDNSRPYKPSPLRSRQPSVPPKVPLPPRPDAYLPEASHKRRPSEMDIPRDVFPDDGERFQFPASRRTSEQPHATVRASGRERAKEPKPTLVPASVASTRMMAKVQGTVRVKDASVPRPVKLSMTITSSGGTGRPDSYEGEVVVLAPFSLGYDPPNPLLPTGENCEEYGRWISEGKLIESLLARTAQTGSNRRDTYSREQLEFALAEPETVRPLSVHKKSRHRAGQ
ncbi:hypothetical protein LXA43DRAFT_621659 [Ganoderma leucocontextum]|nr:hypothetical protein LXA43DRAFT_621659 [Ganoderma leucocontextum]